MPNANKILIEHYGNYLIGMIMLNIKPSITIVTSNLNGFFRVFLVISKIILAILVIK